MFKNVAVKNFKCFPEHDFKLAPLTIFCGSNSAGKSTAIQSILSVIQNVNNIDVQRFALNGELFSFGRVKDLLSHTPNGDKIEISIDDFKLSFDAGPRQLELKELTLENESVSGFEELKRKLSNDFVYLCAERYGPRTSFESSGNTEKINVGIYGQYALSEYKRMMEKPAQNQEFARVMCADLLNGEKPTEEIFTDVLVKETMKRICPSFSMKVVEADEIDRVYNMYTSGLQSMRPNNVGFGVSYVLPIIISAAILKPGGLLIVENPEVHLHPSAQSALIKILCELSMTGIQVIVETHSDHIVNGIRVFAKDNDMFSEENNIIHSVSDRFEKRRIKEIHVDEDGNLTALDAGFFDQINKDLMRLF
ncbi:hypothetical protein A1OU_07190 [Enterovibrio norvegicus]|nr:hypothetical protein A1OU_07190 [Enterovibrio norvegicus]